MTSAKLAIVVLAAGQGTRMKSSRPKVLHEIAGKTMLDHVLDGVATLLPERVVAVIGPDMEETAAAVQARGAAYRTAIQERRGGTGHALASAKDALEGYHGADGSGDILVIFGDTPLLLPETLQAMALARQGDGAPDLLGLAFQPAEPGHYGRVVLDDGGQVLRIVEYADADEQERAIAICNAGILLGDGPILFSLVERLGTDNAKGEYYLTDVFALAHAEGHGSRMAEASPEEVMGVNSRAELAVAEAVIQIRLRAAAMAGGATLIDPTTVWFSSDTRLGRDVTIQPNVYFGPGVTLGDGVEIRAFSHIEGAEIEAGAMIGPFARLRPGTRVGAGARIGNFVEVKNAVFGAGAKANHLSYLGDAVIGPAANIGAGAITCNYDGVNKHRTEIGRGAFIGSNTALVAPVKVGDGAIVGAGSTITRDVENESVAVARSKQTALPGAARRFRKGQDTAGSGSTAETGQKKDD